MPDEGELNDVRELAHQALLTSQDDPMTLVIAAHSFAWVSREYDIALSAMDRALHLNPNSADILIRSGWVRNWVSDADLAIEHFKRSIRLNPIDPEKGFAVGGLSLAYIEKGDYSEALSYARQTKRAMPRWLSGWVFGAVAAAYCGKVEEAREAVSKILTISPGYSIASRTASSPNRDSWVEDRIAHVLRRAGLPEG